MLWVIFLKKNKCTFDKMSVGGWRNAIDFICFSKITEESKFSEKRIPLILRYLRDEESSTSEHKARLVDILFYYIKIVHIFMDM